MTFPDRKFETLAAFCDAYFEHVKSAAASVDRETLSRAARLLEQAYAGGASVYCCGSENVVRAAAWAKENGLKVIALTGFEGGRTAKLADVDLHVKGDNYGVIEDVHQSIMHILSQFIRQNRMSDSLIKERKF
jgi:phosphoheptose isomerase